MRSEGRLENVNRAQHLRMDMGSPSLNPMTALMMSCCRGVNVSRSTSRRRITLLVARISPTCVSMVADQTSHSSPALPRQRRCVAALRRTFLFANVGAQRCLHMRDELDRVIRCRRGT
eukprot:scaffold336_cov250-Pinguiococcus_pyrenoidosus.AAC.35